MASLTDITQATLTLYLDCAKKASQALLQSWLLLPASVVTYLLFHLLFSLLSSVGGGGGMGFAMGFILGFIQIALLAVYYGWLSECREKGGLRTSALATFDSSLFFTIISAAFLIFIAEYLVSALVAGVPGAQSIPLFLQLAIVIIFNALPETIYLHRYEGMPALSHAATFTRENWIEWFLPFLLLLLPVISLSPQGAVYVLATSEALLPPLTIVTAWKPMAVQQAWLHGSSWLGWALTLISLVIANWYMLFRGYLFLELESGTRRNRAFRNRQR